MTEPAPPDTAPSGTRRRLRPWVVLVLVAFVAALGIRLFVAEAFRIPTASMERTLLVGDFVLVSKLHYGARTPATFGVPFTDDYLGGVTLPTVRLPGFTDVARGDVVVFNHPLEQGPVDRRTHFIKRVVGLPGDTVALVAKEVRIDGAPFVDGPEVKLAWLVTAVPGRRLTPDAFREAGIEASVVREGEGVWRLSMTEAEAETVAAWPEVGGLRPVVAARPERLFPYDREQTPDDYGPVVVPAAGQTVRLTPATWPVVRDVIERYEGRTARRFADGRYEIDGALVDTYTFRQDYFFVLGDNRDDSSDSRRWGFVPRSHLVGKAVLVYFSWDARAGQPRFDRWLRLVR